ncbi:MAG: acylphosphatase [Pseudomonadales bacterium]|jgi:acylphosphatase|nr:acylphosphatase [Pseudomonadales bacterium]MDP6317420.1 acylphosphatase [Pseudomonadales bacterium]MDP7316385.1 acylphosphatase [Pseudomonadales bacterium]MDP7577570.1 acylphosphatase [Pseudomonadales bacterium]HJP52245.1 acylphosphatase [Pseudomonadales bacterium]|tara:strand:- start:1261 stop:1539 length:279 start_codon:yes stop_codon:yes gene_type:complete
MSNVSLHAFVSGRVQGVFYRGSLEKQAERLGLTGYVRNLADGRVEYLVFGDQSSVDELLDWSRRGPIAAKVADVAVVEYSGDEQFSDFMIRY